MGKHTVTVDFRDATGKIKPMHSINNGPIVGAKEDLFHYLGEAGIPYSRLHDTGGRYGSNCFVDIENIFRDFDADETDPDSYDFAFTDWLLAVLDKNGVKPFYRLGATIENYHRIKAYRIYPPKDPLKWAKICEGIIRHYNEGWANGFHYGIEYWEIWNEPDNAPDPEDNPMWQGSKQEYFALYETASNYLKAQFPHLKIGGYASCGFYAIVKNSTAANANVSARYSFFLEYFEDFLTYITSPEHRSPLDFFSWHSYGTIEETVRYAAYARERLDAHGFTAAESILNEWNPGIQNRGTALDAAQIAGMMCALQDSSVDHLMYYDGQVNSRYGGMFEPVYQSGVYPAYYAFALFHKLYQLETQVLLSGVDGFYGVAAANNDHGGILFANPRKEQQELLVHALGLSGAPGKVTEISDSRCNESYPLAWEKGMDGSGHTVSLVLPPNSVSLVTGAR